MNETFSAADLSVWVEAPASLLKSLPLFGIHSLSLSARAQLLRSLFFLFFIIIIIVTATTIISVTMALMIRSEVFSCFVFYGVLLVLKMYIVAIITGQVRLRKKAFANPEDALRHGGLQYHREDPYVERCRRAHLNDMENIFPFLFLGAIYSLTGPSLSVARFHFLVFFLGRVLHTVAYLFALRAPTRSLAYTVAQIPCVSMAVQILMAVAAYA